MKTFASSIIAVLYLVSITGCRTNDDPVVQQADHQNQIISLNGSITEILYELRLDSLLVGVDITSTYPGDTRSKMQLGHAKSIQTEKLVSLEASLLLAMKGEVKPEILKQISKSGTTIHLFDPPKSPEEAYDLIKGVCRIFNMETKAAEMTDQIQSDLQKIRPLDHPPRILFIYARGTGNLMVAGEDTSLDHMIQLSGGVNAVRGFSGFKPLNTESLLAANPDVLLLFESGVESLEGMNGLLSLPGVAQTKAGKFKQIHTMDGQLLAGMGPRLGQAAKELNDYLSSIQGSEL